MTSQYHTIEKLPPRETKIAAMHRLNRDSGNASAVVIGMEGSPIALRTQPKRNANARVDYEESFQTFVVSDLIDGSRYVVVSQPAGNTIIATLGPIAIVTTGPDKDVTEIASRAIHEVRQ